MAAAAAGQASSTRPTVAARARSASASADRGAGRRIPSKSARPHGATGWAVSHQPAAAADAYGKVPLRVSACSSGRGGQVAMPGMGEREPSSVHVTTV